MSLGHCIAAAPLLAALAACAGLSPPPCPAGQRAAVQEMLFFGTDTPYGRVTPEDWTRFLGETVTPRFPEGLTAWPASGQWRSASGALIHEPSYVLSLVHPPSAAADESVQELMASYKAKFQQEAVLRVKANVCISL